MSGRQFAASVYEPNDEERRALRALGFSRIPLDIPWPMEPVNATLVWGEPIALIDVGMRYMDNMSRLTEALRKEGLRLEDVGEIWLTHPHIDHFGLAGELAEKTGATVKALASTKFRLDNYMPMWEEDRAWVRETMRLAGVEREIIQQSFSSPSQFHEMGGPVCVDQTLEDGQSVHIAGRPAVVHHVPGHSPWCTSFFFPEERAFVSGDALLERISANPLLYPPSVASEAHQGLRAFRHSLERIASLEIAQVLPGHGRSFSQHTEVVRRALESHDRRRERVLQVLSQGALTPWALAQSVFGVERARKALFLIMSEILRHIDWLLADGKAVCEESSEGWRVQLTQATTWNAA